MQTPPNEPQAQLRWLVDRAQISDVLVEYARCADAADAAGAVMAVFSGTHHMSGAVADVTSARAAFRYDDAEPR